MEATDFSHCRIGAMINLRHPLAVLGTRLLWGVTEASLAPKFERRDRPGQFIDGQDTLFPGNPYDGHILSAVLEQTSNLLQDVPEMAPLTAIELRLGQGAGTRAHFAA